VIFSKEYANKRMFLMGNRCYMLSKVNLYCIFVLWKGRDKNNGGNRAKSMMLILVVMETKFQKMNACV
jgi:hypothetical protein